MGQWKVIVDRDICVGSGTCTALASHLFTLDEEDRSRPTATIFDELPQLIEAAHMCPTGAIDVIDAGTGASVVHS